MYFPDVFPQPFEGCKLAINKGLSNHFQVSHTLQLSGMGPGAYHFGATYVGNKQMGPNEVSESPVQYTFGFMKKVLIKFHLNVCVHFFLQNRRYYNSKECLPVFFSSTWLYFPYYFFFLSFLHNIKVCNSFYF